MEQEKMSKNTIWLIVLSVILVITLGVAAAGLGVADNIKTGSFNQNLTTNNTVKMTLKTGSNLLYTYPLDLTPANNSSKFSGYFDITVQAPGGIPNIIFSVQDDFGRDLTESDRTILAPVTRVYFTGRGVTSTIKLYVNVQTDNQDLQAISVYID